MLKLAVLFWGVSVALTAGMMWKWGLYEMWPVLLIASIGLGAVVWGERTFR